MSVYINICSLVASRTNVVKIVIENVLMFLSFLIIEVICFTLFYFQKLVLKVQIDDNTCVSNNLFHSVFYDKSSKTTLN